MRIKTTSSFKIEGEDNTVWVRKSDDDDTVEIKDDSDNVMEISVDMARAIANSILQVVNDIENA